MTLLKEANLDDQFNKQLGKIQDAVIALEKLVKGFEAEGLWATPTSLMALRYASEDLKKLHDSYAELRAKKGLK